MKLKTLHIKNISLVERGFFAPLNTWVKPLDYVDVLFMCEGCSEVALKIADAYRGDMNWQIFEMFDGTPTSPEGDLQNFAAALIVENSLESKETQEKKLSKVSKKPKNRTIGSLIPDAPNKPEDLES